MRCLERISGARSVGPRVAIVRDGECDESAFAALQSDVFVSRLEQIIDWIDAAE